DRARMAEMIYSLRLENLKVHAMLDIKRDRVSSLRLHMSLSQEEFCQICKDHDDARGRLRRNGNGNGNGNDNGNGNGKGNGNDNRNGSGNGNGNGDNGGDNGDGNENHNVNGRGDRYGWSNKVE
ncbi:hypothetical protein Tco_0118151, partial [Tanacetum coccineum]